MSPPKRTGKGKATRMDGNIEKEQARLAQAEFLTWMGRELRATDMLDVYAYERGTAIFCALIPDAKAAQSMKRSSWDLRYGSGAPGSIVYGLREAKTVEYFRFGNDDGVEPLIILREFHGIRPNYAEIGEEFRLFHGLYHDRQSDRYIKIDDAGSETIVAEVSPQRVRIRVKEIRQFLAIKEMHLVVTFDCDVGSEATLSQLGLTAGPQAQHTGEILTYSLAYGDYSTSAESAFSTLLGKRLITPLPKEQSGFWGFAPEEEDRYVEFIIGVDEAGKDVLHSSDHERLGNLFGGNPGAPQYLTPVYFRRAVLDKYYQQSSKYSVEDGYLRCGGFWGMRMDNHQKDQVMAWLGDLGRDLPYEEQLHWRSYNIQPNGRISATTYRRQILAVATNSDRPEHEFSRLYQRLAASCAEVLGWQVLLPLASEDLHHLGGIRIPATDEQKDFDDLVLALTKILVDSLNEKELSNLVPAAERGEIKGSISRLEKAMAARGVVGFEEHIKFLRSLQELRSAGTAHRKGGNYRRIAEELGIGSTSLPVVFESILVRANRMLQYLDEAVNSGSFRPAVARDDAPPS